MKFYIEVFISKSTNKKCFALIGETPIRKYTLSFDTSIMIDALDMTPSTFAKLGVGKYDIEYEGRFEDYQYE